MDGPLPTGKLPPSLLEELLRDVASVDPDVIVGPSVGEDAAAIALGGGDVLVVATDPITLTGTEVGALAVTINANDVAVTGARPRWFLATVLLPPGTTAQQVREVFTGLREALDREGVSLVGGHTEVTGAVVQPVVCGQMLGLVHRDRLVRTGGARPGDAVVQIGAVPIEGAAVLAAEAAERLGDLPPDVVDAARRAAVDPGVSVVAAALAATDLGATSMHDPTEGGLASGLHEVAAASGCRARVDRSAVLWFEPGVRVCEALGADPWATLASGSVVATFPPGEVEAAVAGLRSSGFSAAVIGAVVAGEGLVDLDGGEIGWPLRDEVARVLGG